MAQHAAGNDALKIPKHALTDQYERFLLETVTSLASIPNLQMVDCADGSTMAVNTSKKRAAEIKDPVYDFPYPIFVLYSVTKTSFFGKPKDFEQDGFTLRLLDQITWLKGSTPDKWVDCNEMGPETARDALRKMAEEVYPSGSPFLEGEG